MTKNNRKSSLTFDLVLRGGRVIDPASGTDRTTDVAFADGRVAAVGDGLVAAETHNVAGHIVAPGLIDLHTHVYWGGTSLGIDAEAFCRTSGVTTAVDTGSAGPGNFRGFRRHVIEPSEVRILAYLHVSFAGIFAFSETIMVGESEELRLLAPREAVAVARANSDVVVGIKVRVGRHASGSSGIAPLEIALEVAEACGLPLMAHIDEPPPSYEAVLDRLRPGDVLTHAFRPFPNTPVDSSGRVKDAVWRARERGVVFDIGHGKGSFAFATGRAMLAGGFAPDVISSDIHTLCIDGPVYDQVTTLSKFLALGMELDQVIACTTVNAAKALQRPELGSLAPGKLGDATVLRLEQGSFAFTDVVGDTLTGSRRLLAAATVIGGRWWHPAEWPRRT